jgi:hypothetical protein
MVNARKILIFSLGLLLIAILSYMYTLRAGLYNELNALKLLPQQEPLTELYLNDSIALPAAVNAGQTIPFSFTIHNLEGMSESYSYNVSMVLSNGKKILVASSSVMLADQASTTISESVSFMDSISSSTSATVYIELPAFNESLHFVLPSREQE